jgi:hypothetical protein
VVDGKLIEEDAASSFDDWRLMSRYKEAQRTLRNPKPDRRLAERENRGGLGKVELTLNHWSLKPRRVPPSLIQAHHDLTSWRGGLMAQ